MTDPDERLNRERTLRGLVLAGDEDAWRAWYEATFDALDAYVVWRCGGRRDVADEVVQETWLIAVRHVRRFRPEDGSFLGWLRGIAANVLRNHLRRAGRHRLVPSVNGHAEPADAAAVRRDEADRVARALASLPERYEAALRAKYLDGQSVAAIAAATNETPKAVESLLTRARAAFRIAYGDPS